MSLSKTTAGGSYDSGLLVAPPAEVTANALTMKAPADEVGDLLIALLGWDVAVQSLAESSDVRAGRILPSVLSWLLLS